MQSVTQSVTAWGTKLNSNAKYYYKVQVLRNVQTHVITDLKKNKQFKMGVLAFPALWSGFQRHEPDDGAKAGRPAGNHATFEVKQSHPAEERDGVDTELQQESQPARHLGWEIKIFYQKKKDTPKCQKS